MKQQVFKAGDLVRVSRNRYSLRTKHHHRFGIVGCVVSGPDRLGDYFVKTFEFPQFVRSSDLKLAKQAMKKRALYANRRG